MYIFQYHGNSITSDLDETFLTMAL